VDLQASEVLPAVHYVVTLDQYVHGGAARNLYAGIATTEAC